MFNLKTTTLALSLAATMALVGCATVPGELSDARATFASVKSTDAQAFAPAEYDDARVALEAAEKSFDDDGDSPRTRAMAYAAERKAQNAYVASELMLAQTNEDVLDNRLATKLRIALSDDGMLVKRDAPRTVISISGAVLFEYDKAKLLPLAKKKLDTVASALRSHPNKNLVIEGHADAIGPDDYNDALSLDRARAVKAYLTDVGIDDSRVTVVAQGEDEPIASNASPEGRANNRRVELIFYNAQLSMN